MLDDPCIGVIGDQIVVFIIPGQCKWADHIPGFVPAEPALFLYGVLKIVETNLAVVGNAGMDRIHIVVDGLIHRLDPVLDKHLPIEKLRFIYAGQVLNLLDEGHGLLVGDEL